MVSICVYPIQGTSILVCVVCPIVGDIILPHKWDYHCKVMKCYSHHQGNYTFAIAYL